MRRDVFSLRTEAFARTLEEIAELKSKGEWEDVIKIVGMNLERLLKISLQELRNLTETGLLARVVMDGPTFWVPQKLMMLIALLKETGDYATMRKPPAGGFKWYLRSLHLLLNGLERGEIRQDSEIAPKVEVLLAAVAGSSLPIETRLLLMREHERQGQYGRVRDEFLAALERFPQNFKLVDYGIAVFERLRGECGGNLSVAGLRRSEMDDLLSELIAMRGKLKS